MTGAIARRPRPVLCMTEHEHRSRARRRRRRRRALHARGRDARARHRPGLARRRPARRRGVADRVGQVRLGARSRPRGRRDRRRRYRSLGAADRVVDPPVPPTRTPPRSPPGGSSTGSTRGSASRRRATTPSALLASLADQVEHVRANLAPARNHRTLELYALLIAALAFPELDAGLLELAVAELDRNLADRLPARRRAPRGLDALPRDRAALVRRRAREHPPLRDRVAAGFDERLDRARALRRALHPPGRDDPGALRRRQGRLLGAAARRAAPAARAPRAPSASFPDGGYHVQRSGWDPEARFLIFDCGPLGDGGHGHYDLLSFEAHGGGRPLVVDPGRGSYSEAPPNLRRWFRGTAAHNTVLRRRARPDALQARPAARAGRQGRFLGRASRARRARRRGDQPAPTRPCTSAGSRSSTTLLDRRGPLESGREHRFDLRFHLAPGRRPRRRRHGARPRARARRASDPPRARLGRARLRRAPRGAGRSAPRRTAGPRASSPGSLAAVTRCSPPTPPCRSATRCSTNAHGAACSAPAALRARQREVPRRRQPARRLPDRGGGGSHTVAGADVRRARARSVYRRARGARCRPARCRRAARCGARDRVLDVPQRPPARRAARCSTAAPARSTELVGRRRPHPPDGLRARARGDRRVPRRRRPRARLREGPLGRRRARARQRRGRRGRGRARRSAPAAAARAGAPRCPTARSCSSRWPATGSTACDAELAPALRALGAGARDAARRPPAAAAALRPPRRRAARARRRGDRPRPAGLRARRRRAARAAAAGGPPAPASRSTCTATRTCATRCSTAAASALVDLEDAAAGPAAADLGFVLAGLLAARAQDRRRRGRAARRAARGYARPAPPDRRRCAGTPPPRCSRASRCRRSGASAPPCSPAWSRCCAAEAVMSEPPAAALLLPALGRPRPPDALLRAVRRAGRALPRRAALRRRAARRHPAARRRRGAWRCRRSGVGADGRLRQPRPALHASSARGPCAASAILAAFRAVRPAAVLVELFPFGRAKFARELVPLLEAARARRRAHRVQPARHPRQPRAPTSAPTTSAPLRSPTPTSTPCSCTATRASRGSRRRSRRGAPLRVPVHYTGFVVRDGDRAAPRARRARGGLGRRRARRRAAAARRRRGAARRPACRCG